MTWVVLSWAAGRERETVRLDGYYTEAVLAEDVAGFVRSYGQVALVLQLGPGQPSVEIPEALFDRSGFLALVEQGRP